MQIEEFIYRVKTVIDVNGLENGIDKVIEWADSVNLTWEEELPAKAEFYVSGAGSKGPFPSPVSSKDLEVAAIKIAFVNLVKGAAQAKEGENSFRVLVSRIKTGVRDVEATFHTSNRGWRR